MSRPLEIAWWEVVKPDANEVKEWIELRATSKSGKHAATLIIDMDEPNVIYLSKTTPNSDLKLSV